MSRSGYTYDCEHLDLYRNAVDRALCGKRGQAFLRELADAMDAMPVKELIAGELIDANGACCAIGVVCKARGTDVSRVYYDDPQAVGKAVGVAWSMAAEIEHWNDDGVWPPRDETPAERWVRMRRWVAGKIVATNEKEASL